VVPQKEKAALLKRVLISKEGKETQSGGKTVPAMSQMSYYFRFYLSRAMESAGLADRYVDELAPWREMLKMGLSTWAEQPEPTRSDCHAWSASPNYDLLTVVAGIHPDAPGFARVRIEPHLGELDHLDASMPHAGGDIRVSYKRVGSGLSATVLLPDGLPGNLLWKGHSYALHGGEQQLQLP
jgi:hypothetical protein